MNVCMLEKERKQVRALHEDDIDNLLEKFGLKEKFYNSVIKCKFCGVVIDRENIYSILRESGSLNFVCNNPKCVIEMSTYLEIKKRTMVQD